MFECCYIAGRCDHPECGAYPEPLQREPEPTIEDYCGADGHPYYGDQEEIGRCYCGQRTFPAGVPSPTNGDES